MILVVGLGNPGKKFEKTRHNLGFRIINGFAGKNNFPDFRLSKKYNAAMSENVLAGEKIILAKPQTFMNESGKAVRSLIKNHKLETPHQNKFGTGQVRNLVVVHDDLDLPFGKIRISIGKNSGGHKGVESIIKELGTKDFVRFRVGIMNRISEIRNTEKFVLEKFTREEEEIFKEVAEKTIEAIELALKEGTEKAMSLYNN